MLWCKVLRTLTRAHQSRKCPTQVLRRRCAYRACCCARCSGPQEMSKHSRRAPTKDAPESHRSLHHMRAWTDGQPEHVQRRRVVIHVKAQRKPTGRALKGGNCNHLHKMEPPRSATTWLVRKLRHGSPLQPAQARSSRTYRDYSKQVKIKVQEQSSRARTKTRTCFR